MVLKTKIILKPSRWPIVKPVIGSIISLVFIFVAYLGVGQGGVGQGIEPAVAQNIAQPNTAQSTDETKSQPQAMYFSQPISPLTSSPGGGKVGDVYQNTKAELIEERGAWSHVSIKAWVRSQNLTKAAVGRTASRTTAQNAGSDLLSVDSFTVKKVTEGIDRPRIYLNLKLKSGSSEVIKSWTGLLAVQKPDAAGTVLFRETISQDASKIEPGAIGEVSFYWDNTEAPYSKLENRTEAELKLTLFHVKINGAR